MRIPAAALCVLLIALANPVRGADGHSTNNFASQDLKKFQVAPGLKVELFASEPLLQNPVCFSIDQQGRFFVVETHRYRNAIFDITANTPWLLDDLSFRTVEDRAAFLAQTFATNFAVLTNDSEIIRLVEDRNGGHRADDSRAFADGFNKSVAGTAAGVLAQGTNVWFTCIPDLWKLSSTSLTSDSAGVSSSKGEGRVKNVSYDQLVTGLGVHISVSGHDVHGLIRGHDGRIYFSFGDRGVCVTNREGVVLNVPDTGGVLRCEPDGRNLEIFCTGLRNPQELAFDDYGNLWTVDNDTAGADPCRVLHLVEGGDYGWRASYQHMKGFGPWVQEELWRGGLDGILPPAGTVSQGPAGLAFYPGTSATPQLAGKFVHADFPGGVWAYDVKPRGASYEIADKEKILWNCWPTDVDFGPDGALYVLDWVQGWTPPGKGRIYRLTANDQSPMTKAQREMVRQTQRLLSEGMSKRNEKELLALLGHVDRRVRLEAQWELAERGTNSLKGLTALAGSSRNQMQRIHALWGTRQIVRELPLTEGGAELASLIPLLEDKDAEIRGQVALALGEGQLFNAETPMEKLLSDPSPRVRMLATQAYTERWRGDFGPTGRRKRPRIHFSTYQSTIGPIAENVSRVIGVNPHEGGKAVGSVISGSFPADKLNGLLPKNSIEPFVMASAVNFLVNTRRNTAFESHFELAPSVESALALVLTYRRTTNAVIGVFLTNREPRVVLEAARAINDGPVAESYSALAAILGDARFRDATWGSSALSNTTPSGPFSAKVRLPREQVLLRALNSHYRLGSVSNAEALVRFARGTLNSDLSGASSDKGGGGIKTGAVMPASLRAEALFLLGAWEVLPAIVGDLSIKPTKDPNHGSTPTVNPENWPGWFDRVVGLYRPLQPRSAESARLALDSGIAALVSDEAVDVAQAALEASVKLRLSSATPALLARLHDANSPASLRRKVPGALAVVGPDKLSEAVQVALTDSSAEVRASALPFLDRLDSTKAAEVLGRIVASDYGRGRTEAPADGQLALVQAALGVLGGLKNPAANTILRSALTNLFESRLPSGLELDLLEASARRDDPEIKTLLARRESAVLKTNGLWKWQATLHGGNAERGRTIFFEKAETQCSRCHQVKGEGGIVGPALDKIARQRNREYLLEAIVFPNKAIASGFENVVLTLKNGSSLAGVVKSEDVTWLRLDSPEDGAMKIAKSEIVERRRGLSAMPEETAQQLTMRELRDLVEFLASLK